MNAGVFAIVTWCGAGSIRLFPYESEAREVMALLTARGCSTGCTREHRIIKLGEVLS